MNGTARQRDIAKALTLLIPLAPFSETEAIRQAAGARHMKELTPA
ncbi:MAG: DUF2293 domain-containing protein, partial [Mesorhizobium sp.]|nr:DUF2293 domain-containing protein [Mesorhizobium sp.]